MREYSIPALAQIPATANLADVVFRRAQTEPDTVMLRQRTADGSWQDVTARQFRDEVSALAKGLIAAGIDPGDRVALMSHTRYEWTLIDYAIWAAGAVTVQRYTRPPPAEQVEWILGDLSSVRGLRRRQQARGDDLHDTRDRLPGLTQLWQFGMASTPWRQALTKSPTSSSISAGPSGPRPTWRRSSIPPAPPSRPKSCELTHANLLADVRNAFMRRPLWKVIDSVSGGSTMLFLPLAHSFAHIIQVGCLESGAILGHWPRLPDAGPGPFPEFRPTFLLAVPQVFEKVFSTAPAASLGEPGQGQDLRRCHGHRDRLEQITRRRRQADPAGAPRAVFDRLVYAGLRAAVGGARSSTPSPGGGALGERLGHFFRGAGIPAVLEGTA